MSSPIKRFKRDDSIDPLNPDPSAVVHIRQLSPKATEADLVEALQHFGPIAYVTMITARKMGLVEFEDVKYAKQCVQYAQTNQIYIAGQPALFNFSTSKSIQRMGLESDRPNNVVILTISNVTYPVDVNTIYTICKPHGQVYRIATFRRVVLQALVEFDSIESAKAAKHALNGADIYSGCCTLKVEFAKPDHVTVHQNDNTQWDYTVSSDDMHLQRQQRLPINTDMRAPEPRKSLLGPVDQSYNNSNMSGYNMGYSGNPNMGGPGPSGPYSNPGMMNGPGQGMMNQWGPQAGVGSFPPGALPNSYGSVVMVYGIDHEHWNCDRIFNLLCLFGNISKIKLMKTKPDTAMVQYSDQTQMQNAIQFLHGITAFATKLALRPSKQQNLATTTDPFILPDGSPSFADYSQSRNNRFNTPEAASRNRLVRPSVNLHWYNAPANMTEDKLCEIFEESDAQRPTKVIVFQSKSDRSSSGIAEFGTVDAAVEALIKCNHTDVPSPIGKIPYVLKLAFAGGGGAGRDH